MHCADLAPGTLMSMGPKHPFGLGICWTPAECWHTLDEETVEVWPLVRIDLMMRVLVGMVIIATDCGESMTGRDRLCWVGLAGTALHFRGM